MQVLSSEQKSLWSLQEMDLENPSYITPLAFRVSGRLRPDLVEIAWLALIRKYAVLRTCFRLVSDELVAEVTAQDDVEFTVDRHRLGTPDDVGSWLKAESGRAFKLNSELPVRVALAEITPSDHVLLVSTHHIAVDGWSLELLQNEFWDIYETCLTGGAPAIDVGECDYREYARWQSSDEGRRQSDYQVDYWSRELADLEVATIRRTRRDQAEREWAGEEYCFEISRETAESLRVIAEQNATTLFCVLLTAWHVLVGRHANEQDVSVGVPMLGRTDEKWSDVIGNFVNIVPIRLSLTGDVTFLELLRATSSAVMGALENQDARYESIAKRVLTGQSNAPDLFQTVFNMKQMLNAAETSRAGLSVRAVKFEEQFAKYDVSVELAEYTGAKLDCSLVFKAKYFDRQSASRIAEHFSELLRSIGRSPGLPLRLLNSVPDDEKRALADLVKTTAEPKDVIHRLFEDRAREFPEAVAVTAGESVSYREVNERANRLARHLVRQGVSREMPVGISLGRGPGLIVGMLAVLKSGALYVPLDASSPQQRIRSIVTDAGLEVVLADSSTRDVYSDGGYGISVIDIEDPGIERESSGDLDIEGDPGDGAYIIFTSGSMGRPKGVCVTHANVTRLLAAGTREFDFRRDDVWTMFHSYAFDFSVWEMYGSLLSGSRLVIVSAESARNPEEFLELVVRERVTVLNQTPTAFGSFIGALSQNPAMASDLRLRYVVLGGERMDPGRVGPWFDLMGDTEPALINMYGITETTVHVTFRQLRMADLARPAASPIGRPLSDLTLYVLDEHQQLAGFGVPGELYVGGAGLARGYVNRPDLTAERFFPDPHGGEGERLYRTGDLALVHEDGEFEFLGRADHQVKIHGYRIEPGEVEAAVRGHSSVRKAVVLPKKMDDGSVRLIAYYELYENAHDSAADIRGHARSFLPEYMVPAWFVAVPEFPITPSGKLDVRRLPAPGTDHDRESAEPVTTTPLSAQLADIWKRVLRLEGVGLTDSFFDIGGDSIQAIALVGALREQGMSVSVQDILHSRNITSLAALITERDRAPRDFVPVAPFAQLSGDDRALLSGDVEDAYPLSMTQMGMVYEMLVDQDSLRYHNVSSFRISDDREFTAECLVRAIDIVVGRHQALRSRIDLTTYAEPVQLIDARLTVPVDIERIEDAAPGEIEDHIRGYMERERAHPFDISQAPLFRMFAHVCSENVWWLGMTECHVILEGWSLHSFIMEVLNTYRELRDLGSAEERETPEFRFADYIAEEARALSDVRSRSYWKQVVDSYPKLRLPEARAVSVEKDDTYEVSCSFADYEDRLRTIARDAGVSLKSVLHAVHLKTLSVVLQQNEFYSGLVCDARPEVSGADRVLGMYLNTVPFGIRCGEQTWLEFIGDVFRREVELWAYRQFPLAELQSEMVTRGGRLIDCFFLYLNFHNVDNNIIDYERSIDMSPTEFGFEVRAQNGYFTLRSQNSVLPRPSAQRFIESYRLVVEHLVEEPGSRLNMVDDTVGAPLGLITAAQPTIGHESEAGHGNRAVSHGDGRHMTGTETRTAALWEELFDVEDVLPSDDFFELGGNSMLAIRLWSSIQTEFKVEIPLQTILERRSVTAIADAIERTQQAQGQEAGTRVSTGPTSVGESGRGELVWLNNGPMDRLAFCVHPAGGSSHWYLPVAEELSHDMRLAGFEPRSMLAAVPQDAGIEDVAARYVSLITETVRDQRVNLVGWSAAGSLSWDIAVGLERQGRAAHVVLIDPVAAGAAAMERAARFSLAKLEDLLVQRNGSAQADTTALREVLGELGVPWHASAKEYAANMLGEWKILNRVMLNYRHADRNGETTLVTSGDCHAGRHPLMNGLAYEEYVSSWQKICAKDVAEYRLAGSHMDVMGKAYAERLADIIRNVA